jgi:hypothetical protein
VAAASPLPAPRPPGIQRRWIVSHLVALWALVLVGLLNVGLLIALLVVLA